jgi:hypothetical protein
MLTWAEILDKVSEELLKVAWLLIPPALFRTTWMEDFGLGREEPQIHVSDKVIWHTHTETEGGGYLYRALQDLQLPLKKDLV